jgi:pectate lyase
MASTILWAFGCIGLGAKSSDLGITSITVSPPVAATVPNAKVQFTAAIQGTASNKSVMWTASFGTISGTGVFMAPAAGTSKIIATSVIDATKSASASITVATAGGGPSGPSSTPIVISPSPASSITRGTLEFRATDQSTGSKVSVTWNALLGTISQTGLYAAPTNAGTDTVTATDIADPQDSASARVTVTMATANPIVKSVEVSPASTTVTTGGTLQFAAAVHGTVTDKTVSWTAVSGFINSVGSYTASVKPGADTVTATSNADPSKSGAAAVTVSIAAQQKASCGSSGCPAFPGAEGGGAESVGGRGGTVMEVTTLNDTGSGSLRACLEASGPRTCVFRVSGLITGRSRMQIQNPYITIAGQTAPGGGIVVGGPNQQAEQIFISTHDVVIRYLTYDGNNPNTATGPDTGTVGFELASGNIYNVVLDHISGRWWGNKPFLALSNDSGNVHDVTYQWIMCYEPNAGHPVGPMADATSGSARNSVNIDWHHSFFANTGHRLPLVDVGSMRWVNNIVYNWDFFAALTWGGAKMDYIGNKYVPGNLNAGNGNHEFDSNPNNDDSTDQSDNCIGGNPCDNPGPPSLFLVNNLGPHNSSVTTSPNDSGQKAMTQQGWEGGDRGGDIPNSWFRGSALQGETFPIQPDSVTDLDNIMLNTVGNSQHLDCGGNFVSNRDSQDARVISQYKSNGSGHFFTGQFSAPSIAAGSACTESQHDGIPDQWKQANGLSTSDSTLYKQTAPNGYTYLENYLNGTDPK